MAGGSEFNRDMGDYLKSRRKSSGNAFAAARDYFKGFGKKEEQEPPMDIPQEQVQAVLQGTKVKHTVTHVTQKKVAEEPPHKKVNIMGWFSNKKEDDDYEVVQQQPVLDEDVREVLKITFKWLKMMDQETIDEIKASPDFEKYKAVLDKYGLIKK